MTPEDSGIATRQNRGRRASDSLAVLSARMRRRSLLVVTTAVWLGHAAVTIGGAPTAVTVPLQLAVCALSVLTCVAGARAVSGRAGIALAFAVGAYAEAAAYYALVPHAAKQFPSFFDLGLPLFYCLAAVAVVEFVRLWQAEFGVSAWLDAVLGAAALIALGVVVVGSGSFTRAVAAGQLVYFMGDLTMLGLLAAVWFLRGARINPALFTLAAGALTLAVADGDFVHRVQMGRTDAGSLQLVLWSAAMVLFAAAAGQRPRLTRPRADSLVDVAVPVTSALIALPVVLFSDQTARDAAIIALALIIVRLALGLADNKRLLAERTQAAITDPLTGLANRKALIDSIERGLARPRGDERCVGVLFIDLDDFKSVNDTRGHSTGDRLLVAVADALRTVVRQTARTLRRDSRLRPLDTIGRLGGDEFVVVLDGLGDGDDLQLVAQRLLEQLAEHVALDGEVFPISACIGATSADGSDGRHAAGLLADADIAMYAAKDRGRGGTETFTGAMREEVVATASLVADLRRALDNGEMRVLYQPQVDLDTGEIVGAEALVRWQHPELGLLAPARFIDLAERHGLIASIDDWVLEQACAQLGAWHRQGLDPLQIAVNISGHRLSGADLAATIDRIVETSGISHADLEIEVTETVAVKSDRLAVDSLERVRASGVAVAIDDFGVGHSALSRLLSFPVDRLKVDRAFVTPLTADSAPDSLVAAMVAMARSLRVGIIAEGVETEEHLSALRQIGCGRGQGYLFARPLPPEELERLIIERRLTLPKRRAETGELAQPTSPSIHAILSELERVTGFESTYVTTVSDRHQRALEVRNTGELEIPADLDVPWEETLCRRVMNERLVHTDQVAEEFDDIVAAQELGLRSFATVPLRSDDGRVVGTLCAASRAKIPLGEEADEVMRGFARLIEQRIANAVPRAD